MKAMLKRAISVFLVVAIVLCSAPLSGLIGLDLPDWADLSIKSSAATVLYWPVPGHTNRGEYHDECAIDITDGSIGGATVIAAIGGTVTHIFLCGTKHYGSYSYNGCNCQGFGTGLVIKGDDGRIYQYAHMQAGSIPSNVYRTAYVSAGQKIGQVGTTGYSSGNHLHFGISYNNWWEKSGINPLNESYNYSEPHSHSYTATITKQPTCTDTGIKTFKCSCGESYTQTIKATGHSYNTTSVLPTETEQGYTLYECKNCSYSYKDDYIDPPVYQDGWYYCDALPSNINSDNYIIEYKHYYEKQQQESPGDDWTNAGVAKTEWVNSGEAYTSYNNLTTSDSRILVDSYYYHICGPNSGQTVNYEYSDSLVHWDSINAKQIASEEFVEYDADGGMPVYFLKWADGSYVYCQSDVTCDGAYGSHGQRSKYWYKMNHYQDRVKVTTYKFTKETDYISELDESATDITYRYKLNHIHATEEQIIPATCTATGLKKVVCTTCNEIISSTIIPMIAHNYSTFVEFGTEHPHYAVYKCVCGARQTKTETSNDDKCEICNPSDTNGEFKFSIKEPSRTTIRCKDGIVLRANIENVPSGAKIVWTTNNNNFDFEQSSDGKSLMIISSNNGYTTFTATLIDSNGDILSYDTVEMYSKAGFFDKLGGFFRSLFGATKIYEN